MATPPLRTIEGGKGEFIIGLEEEEDKGHRYSNISLVKRYLSRGPRIKDLRKSKSRGVVESIFEQHCNCHM